jgi:hypothetical protein
MFLESELGTITLATAMTIPSGNLLRGREICFATGKALFPFVECSNVYSQVALLGKATIASVNRAVEDFPIFKAYVTVCDFKMAT